MKISLNWLKDFVDVDISTERLAETLITAGLEVEGISKLGEGLDDVVVARILSMKPHPNADRLTLCSVSPGDKIHSIVCGAKNMKEGDQVPLALPGALLPNGIKISKSKIRGEASEGMLCSEVELGLAKESSGLMILPSDLTPGTPFAKALMLDDTIFEINITPNRSDCLSVIGIAREVAVFTGKELKRAKAESAMAFEPLPISIEVQDFDACPRYTGRAIKGVKIGQSPLWMKRRLEASGIRSINNIVDVTNYVMLETGQPLHAFDLNLLSRGRIVVRRSSQGEKITTLDGIERVLDGDELIIADNEKALAIAGVMGGTGSEVTDRTTDVFLESAYFKPAIVRKASKRFGLHTESSHRFERGVDPNGVVEASNRAVELILQLAGGNGTTKLTDIYPNKISPVNIEMRLSRAKAIIGMDLDMDSVVYGFKGLGFTVSNADRERIMVTPPTFRFDITREIDLIEEVARLKGYDVIPVTYPKIEARAGEKNIKCMVEDRLRGSMLGMGFFEAVTYSFVSQKTISPFLPSESAPVKLLNPLSEEQSVMRTTIIPSLIEVIGSNLSRQNEDLRFFEIGRVFPFNGDDRGERSVVAGIMIGLRNGKRWNLPNDELDFFDVKGVVENLLEGVGLTASFLPNENIQYLHPGKSATIEIYDQGAGVLGEIHPDVMDKFDIKGRAFVFEIELKPLMELTGAVTSFTHIPKFPAVSRDIAVVLDADIQAARVSKVIKDVDPLITDVFLFDLYQGKHVPDGKKSMAYSVRYQAVDRTLKEEDVNILHEKVLAAIKDSVGGALRE